MKRYKLLSFDMFQTLVDVNTQKDAVMKAILGDDYSAEKSELLWNDANQFVFTYFHRRDDGAKNFVEVVKVFEQCYAELFPKYGVKFDPGAGANLLAKAHGKSRFYSDSLSFLEKVRREYQTCLISDADLIMIEEIVGKVEFDRIYISEKYKAYKFDRSGTLFKAALNDFKIEPQEMLHIGDGYSDTIGAKQVGADSAWINRWGVEWKHEIRPDYVVPSLLDLLECLE